MIVTRSEAFSNGTSAISLAGTVALAARKDELLSRGSLRSWTAWLRASPFSICWGVGVSRRRLDMSIVERPVLQELLMHPGVMHEGGLVGDLRL